ncbi:MAG: hypothetical protein RJA35_1481, partial [Actinomycetota bacterium]
RRHSVDAGIFFSDIVVPLKLAGVEVSIVPGVGPVLEKPIRTRAALESLQALEPQALEPIAKAVSLTVAELGATPLIGFGGAPFTLASYLIEGGPSRELPACRYLMKTDPKLFHDILNYCAQITASFMRAQVLAGASALQLFDSWAGRLTLDDYVAFAQPHSKTVFDSLADLPVAKVHFGVQTKHLLPEMLAAGATVMGVDYEVPLSNAVQILNNSDENGASIPLQGNINPDLLKADWDALRAHIDEVIFEGKTAVSHIVNLGHGVPPHTNPDVLTRIVEYVHQQDGLQ